MPSITQYGQIVNSVLSALGIAELTSGTFLAAVRDQRRVKRIVAEEFESLENALPDEHLNASTDLTVLPTLIRALTNDEEPEAASRVNFVADESVTFSQVGPSLDGPFLTPAWLTEYAPETPEVHDCWFRLHGEDQWYRIQSTGGDNGMVLQEKHAIYRNGRVGSFPDGRGYDIVKLRYTLPPDFRDFRDVSKIFEGIDLVPSGPNEIMKRMSQDLSINWQESGYYAIDYDVEPQVAGAPAIAQITGPKILLWPIPAERRVYRLLYQRRAIALNPDTSAFATLLDLPQDRIEELKYRCKMLAEVEIERNPEAAGVYGQLMSQKRKDTMERTLTASDKSQIRPDESAYRGFYHRSRRGLRGRIIFTED